MIVNKPLLVSVMGHRCDLKDEVILGIIKDLIDKDYRCLFIKNAQTLDMDTKGKDSYELYASGLDYISLITGKHRYLRSSESLQGVVDIKKYDCIIQQNSSKNSDIIIMVDGGRGVKENCHFDVLVSSSDLKNKSNKLYFDSESLPKLFYWILQKINKNENK